VKKLTISQFIEKAKEIHNDKYDYNLVEYKTSHIKVKIICKEHGIFEQQPANHLQKKGCPKCVGKNITDTEFIERARLVHNDKYDYSITKYKYNKVKIICKEHGIFEQNPFNHIKGFGCKKCSGTYCLDQFIEKAKEIHNDKYDYSLVEYTKTNIKVKIICKEHGIFEQTPNCHLSGSGCAICSVIKTHDQQKLTISQFIEKAKEIHNDKYDYNLVEYNGGKNKVKIICKEHGIFEQKAYVHLNNKSGCPYCTGKINNNIDFFISKAKKIHNNRYNYDLVEYKDPKTKIKIICKEHGIFEQTPDGHLNKKSGCQKCNQSKGENEIAVFLENNKINFIQQKKFDLCKNKNNLLFDFFLEENNICIEFQGIQHFKQIDFFGGIKEFEKRIENDNIKRKFCKENKIKLLEISYVDNISKELNNLLLEINSGKNK